MKVDKVRDYSAGYPENGGKRSFSGKLRAFFRRVFRHGRPEVVGRCPANDPEYPEPRLEGEPPVDPSEWETAPETMGDVPPDAPEKDEAPFLMGKISVPPEERD